MIKIDARGDTCPLPVVKAKKAIAELHGSGEVEVLVDNEIAVQNLTKMAQQKGYLSSSEKLAEQEGEHIFKFRVKLNGETKVQAVAGDSIDDAVFRKVDAPNPDYKLTKKNSTSANWV